MNILITGGTGFIGSKLAERCLSNGHKVRVLGLQNTDIEKANSKIVSESGAEIFGGSILDEGLISNAVKDIDIIFHLAAIQHEMNIPDKKFWDVNVLGTTNLLEASVKAGVDKFIYGSTIGVYGSTNGIIYENSPCNPENIYGKTKLEAERTVISYNSKLNAVAIRITETYGPGDRRLLKLFKGLKKKIFFMIGKGNNLHHPIFVEDLISGFLLAAEKNDTGGKVFLLGGPSTLTTNEMVNTIAGSMGVQVPKIRIPLSPMMFTAMCMEFLLRPVGIQPPLHRRRMDFFVKNFSLSTEKAKVQLGFEPLYDFEEGIKITKQWYEKMGFIQ